MMKKWVVCLIAILILCSGLAQADALEDGVAAYNKGNYSQAIKLFRQTAGKGNANAQLYLGAMYDKGEGVTQDYQEAAKWYRLAATQGVSYAQYNLGGMYLEGQGVAQDYREAAKWYRLAAAQGLAEAQSNLGVMYGRGKGVTQDYVHAHMWLSLAATKGSNNAQKGLDIVANKITAAQISESQKLARECENRNYKNCD